MCPLVISPVSPHMGRRASVHVFVCVHVCACVPRMPQLARVAARQDGCRHLLRYLPAYSRYVSSLLGKSAPFAGCIKSGVCVAQSNPMRSFHDDVTSKEAQGKGGEKKGGGSRFPVPKYHPRILPPDAPRSRRGYVGRLASN